MRKYSNKTNQILKRKITTYWAKRVSVEDCANNLKIQQQSVQKIYNFLDKIYNYMIGE